MFVFNACFHWRRNQGDMYSHFWIKGYKPYTFTPTPPPHSSSEPHWKCYRNEENLEETHPGVQFSCFYTPLKTTKPSTDRVPLNPKKFTGIVQEMSPCHTFEIFSKLTFFGFHTQTFTNEGEDWRWGIDRWMTSPRTFRVWPLSNRSELYKYRRLPSITVI